MNRRKVSIILITLLTAGIVFQGGFLAYSMINNSNDTATTDENSITTLNTIVISDEIKALIRSSDEANYEKNLSNYKNLLIELNVQNKFRNEIDRLIIEGYYLPDILTAYSFLNENFGKMSELEKLSNEKRNGKEWTQIFTEYNNSYGEFIPRSFDTEYLEEIMHESYITSDDIMIADIIAGKLNKPFNDVITEKLDGASWKEINEKLEILSSKDELPRVQVTNEQIDKYKGLTGLSEEQIVNCFIMASKLNKLEKEIIDKVVAGYTEEKIYAEYYNSRFY